MTGHDYNVSSSDFSQKSLWRRLNDFLFGYDYFISYAWADGRKYAVKLAEKLEERRLECFLDSDDYAKGDNWKLVGQRALNKTSRLIVVGSPKALVSGPVLREVRIYTNRKRHVIPISFEGSLDPDRTDSPVIHHLAPEVLRLEETEEALATGPSDEIADELAHSFKLLTQEQKRRRFFTVATLSLIALVLTVGLLGVLYRQQKIIADKQEKIASQQREIAEQRREMATAFRLVDHSRQELTEPIGLYRAALLATESLDLFPTPEADELARRSLPLLPEFLGESALLEDEVVQLEFTADSRFVIARLYGGLVVLDPETMCPLDIPHQDAETEQLAVSTRGDRFAVTTEDKQLLIYDLENSVSVVDFHTPHVMNLICFSDNGRFIGTANNFSRVGKVVQLFDSQQKLESRQLQAGSPSDIALSSTGSYLAWSDENKVHVWDLVSQQSLPVVEHDSFVEKLRFDMEDESELVSFDGTDLYRWDVQTSKLLRRSRNTDLDGGTNVRRVVSDDMAFALAEKGDRLFVEKVEEGNNFVLFLRTDMPTPRPRRPHLSSELWSLRQVKGFQFSSDRSAVVIQAPQNILRLFSVDDQREKARVCGDGEPIVYETGAQPIITAFRLSLDGEFLTVAFEVNDRQENNVINQGHIIRVFRTRGYAGVATIGKSPVFFPDDRKVLSIRNGSYFDSIDGGVITTNLSTDETNLVFNQGFEPQVSAVDVSPEGRYLVVGNDDGTIDLRDLKGVNEHREVRQGGPVKDVVFQRNGKHFASASRDNTARVWTVPQAEHVVTVEHEDEINESVNKVCFSPEGNLLGTASGDKTAAIWQLPGGDRLATLEHQNWVVDIAFTPGGEYLATASAFPGGTGCLWRVPAGEEPLHRFEYGAYVNALDVSPDGHYVAFAIGNWGGIRGGRGDQSLGKVEVREVPSGRLANRFTVPSRTVWDVTFGPDGNVVACTTEERSGEGFCRLWSLDDGLEIVRLPTSSREVTFSHGGKFVALDGQVRLWRPDDVIEEVTRRIPRKLTAQERSLAEPSN